MSLVFVSCGQLTTEEKALGQAIADAINEIDGLNAYFADTQTSLEGLTEHIFARLNECVAFVAIMQERGTVTFGNRPVFTRGSLWIEQEIAIASFIQHALKREIRAFAYIQETIEREGLRDELMLNARPFKTPADVLQLFKTKAIPELRKLAARLSTESEVQNKESPLGDLPFGGGPIATEPLAINPNFQFTLTIRPWSYGTIKALAFDADDQQRLAAVLQRGRISFLGETVFPRNEMNGVLFSSNALGRRPDGIPIPPKYQIFVRRDGYIVLQFAQSDGSPYTQLFEIVLEGFHAARTIFDSLGLKPRAYIRAQGTLHAGREQFTPTLSGMIDQRTEIELTKSFSDAFTELVCDILSQSPQPFSRANVSSDLTSAWATYETRNR